MSCTSQQTILSLLLLPSSLRYSKKIVDSTTQKQCFSPSSRRDTKFRHLRNLSWSVPISVARDLVFLSSSPVEFVAGIKLEVVLVAAMSSCLSGGAGAGGRTYRLLDIDIIKSTVAPSPARTAQSSPSSTLSDSSNASSAAISLKKARAPRKRPNQAYHEASSLLAAIYPNIFPASKQFKPFGRLPESVPDLLPPFRVLDDAGFLIRESPPQPPEQTSSKSAATKSCLSPSPVTSAFREPEWPVVVVDECDDFDAESILDEEPGDHGIDSIMGNLAVADAGGRIEEDGSALSFNSKTINPHLLSLIKFGLAGKFELGLGFRKGGGIPHALKNRYDGEWWKSPTVLVSEISPAPSVPAPEKPKKSSKKKKKKQPNDSVKKDTAVACDVGNNAATAEQKNGKPTATASASPRLGLKLNHDGIIEAWSDRGPLFAGGAEAAPPPSSPEAYAKLAEIDLFPEGGGGYGVREASVMRYKEKRRSRLFAKKIRYEVRKVNADRRPRMKASGRFVRTPSLLQQSLEEDS